MLQGTTACPLYLFCLAMSRIFIVKISVYVCVILRKMFCLFVYDRYISEYIQVIMTLEESVQHVVMTAIQEVCLWHLPLTASLSHAYQSALQRHGAIYSSCTLLSFKPAFMPCTAWGLMDPLHVFFSLHSSWAKTPWPTLELSHLGTWSSRLVLWKYFISMLNKLDIENYIDHVCMGSNNPTGNRILDWGSVYVDYGVYNSHEQKSMYVPVNNSCMVCINWHRTETVHQGSSESFLLLSLMYFT